MNRIVLETPANVFELDDGGRYLIQLGNTDIPIDIWTQDAQALLNKLRLFGINNVVVAPEFSIFSELHLGDIVYALDPRSKRKGKDRKLISYKIVAFRQQLSRDKIEDRVLVQQESKDRYSSATSWFKRSSFHKTFFTDKYEAEQVLKICK